ncbi:O-antigen ligase family protein [Patescibacteria group bacterium]|nr:O-antigen ligase family protein [Patescibacteria group bacterium]
MANTLFLNSSRISREIAYTIFATVFVGVFALVNILVGFNLYLYIFCLIFASFFILRKPEVGLYTIIICTFIFERFFTLQPLVTDEHIYKIYPLDILTIMAVSSFVFYVIRRPDVRLKISPVGVAILLFVVLCAVAAIYGVATGGEFSVAFSTFKNFGLYAIFFFITINVIRSRQQLERLIKVFVFTGVVLFFFVFFGAIRGYGLWTEFTPLSTAGARLLAPTHAFYLSISLLLLFNLFAYKKNYFGNLTVLVIFIQLLGVLGSLSRHLWVSLAVGIVLSFILLPKLNKKSLLRILATQFLLLIIVLSVYTWFSFIVYEQAPTIITDFSRVTVDRLQSFTEYFEDKSATFRLFAWQEAWESFAASPLIGTGFGHKLTFDYYGYPTRIEVRDLHNDIVGIGVQMGVLGLVSFFLVNILIIRNSYRTWRQKRKNEQSYLPPFLLGLFACYVMFLINANFGVYFDLNLLVIFFWVVVGALVVINKIDDQVERPKRIL